MKVRENVNLFLKIPKSMNSDEFTTNFTGYHNFQSKKSMNFKNKDE